MNTFLHQDPTGAWNSIPPIPADKISNVNCHKFVLYVLGRISWDDMVSDPHTQKEAGTDFTFGAQAQAISDIPFIPIGSTEALYALADATCEPGQPYIGQIHDADTGEMAHSFIIERTPTGKYVCYDKLGFKHPFGLHELGVILDFINKEGVKSYQNQKWRFVRIG